MRTFIFTLIAALGLAFAGPVGLSSEALAGKKKVVKKVSKKKSKRAKKVKRAKRVRKAKKATKAE